MRSVLRLAAVATAVISVLAGCYTLHPASAMTLEAGSKVAFDINDIGRVALGGQIGPEIGTVEGLLISKDNGEYLLSVSEVRFVRGGVQPWSGERVQLKPDYLGTIYERRFDKGKTVALSAAVIGGATLIFLTRDLLGLGSLDRPIPPVDTNSTFRVPRR
jgi:hypothetical protein